MTRPDGTNEVRQAYGDLAQLYIDLFGTTDAMEADDLALIERHLKIQRGLVLDLGCGPGHLTEHLRSLGVDATGIDLVPEFIDHARVTYRDGSYRVGSIHELDLPDESVAGAVSWYSTIHVPPGDLDAVLREVRRVLVPGAPLVVGFFDGEVVEPFAHKVATAYRWPADEFSRRLERTGFTELERIRRPGVHTAGKRPHVIIAATAA